MQGIIDKAYDPEAFRDLGHQLVDLLYQQLQQSQGEEAPTFYWGTPDDEFNSWMDDLEDGDNNHALSTFNKILEKSIKLHNPNYMGHQIAPPVPISILGGFLSDFLNNGMGVYEMGVASSSLDKVIIKSFARKMGLSEETDGILTSGGTLGNLTAMLAARQNKVKTDIWKEGNQQQLALMVSEEAHYCVDRAVRIMGWGQQGIIKVPTNERYQLRVDLLESYYQRAKENGINIIAVVGSACSTSTGSFDDLHGIADFCAQHQLWMHVDGAHGGPFALSPNTRHLVSGIERADSVVMDFHKSLAIPALSTALFFKNGQLSFRTFSQQADYLFKGQEEEWYNMAKRTFECTKFMMSVKIYSVLKTYGFAFFEAFLDRLVEQGQLFADAIHKDPRFELGLDPACNIICFRWNPQNHLSESGLNAMNDRLRQSVIEEGTFYIVKTKLRGRIWLRCTLTNPFTKATHIQALLDKINAFAHELSVA